MTTIRDEQYENRTLAQKSLEFSYMIQKRALELLKSPQNFSKIFQKSF